MLFKAKHHSCIISAFLINLCCLCDLSYFFTAYSSLHVFYLLAFAICLKSLHIFFSLIITISSILVNLYLFIFPGNFFEFRIDELITLFFEIFPLPYFFQIFIIQFIEPFFDIILDFKVMQFFFSLFLPHNCLDFFDYICHSNSLVTVDS